jgi:hypothetical protein
MTKLPSCSGVGAAVNGGVGSSGGPCGPRPRPAGWVGGAGGACDCPLTSGMPSKVAKKTSRAAVPMTVSIRIRAAFYPLWASLANFLLRRYPDASLVLACEERMTGSGSQHDNSRVPRIAAGGLGGTLETGRTLNDLEAGDSNRKLCSLYLGLMDRVGITLDHWGDADSRLAGL